MAPPRRNARKTTFYSFLKLISTSLSPPSSRLVESHGLLFAHHGSPSIIHRLGCRQFKTRYWWAFIPKQRILVSFTFCSLGLPLLILCCWSLCPKVVPQVSSTSKGPRTVSNLTWIARSPKGLGSYDFPSQTVSGGNHSVSSHFSSLAPSYELCSLQKSLGSWKPFLLTRMPMFIARWNLLMSHVLVATRAGLGSTEKKTIASSHFKLMPRLSPDPQIVPRASKVFLHLFTSGHNPFLWAHQMSP